MKRIETFKLEEIEKKSLQVIAEVDCKGICCSDCPLRIKLPIQAGNTYVCMKLLCGEVFERSER